jgi:hypothetical protein
MVLGGNGFLQRKNKTRQMPLPGSNLLGKIVFAFETIYTTASVNEFLFTGEERVAVGADLNTECLLHGTGFELVTACTSNFYDVVVRMNSLFHLFAPLFRPDSFAETELYKHTY